MRMLLLNSVGLKLFVVLFSCVYSDVIFLLIVDLFICVLHVYIFSNPVTGFSIVV